MNKPLLLQSTAPSESSWAIVDGLRGIRIRGNTPEDSFKLIMVRGARTEQDSFRLAAKLELPDWVERIKIIFVNGPSTVDVDLVEPTWAQKT